LLHCRFEYRIWICCRLCFIKLECIIFSICCVKIKGLHVNIICIVITNRLRVWFCVFMGCEISRFPIIIYQIWLRCITFCILACCRLLCLDNDIFSIWYVMIKNLFFFLNYCSLFLHHFHLLLFRNNFRFFNLLYCFFLLNCFWRLDTFVYSLNFSLFYFCILFSSSSGSNFFFKMVVNRWDHSRVLLKLRSLLCIQHSLFRLIDRFFILLLLSRLRFDLTWRLSVPWLFAHKAIPHNFIQ